MAIHFTQSRGAAAVPNLSCGYTPAMLVWVNGHLVEAAEAAISPFDRGFLFGDGVYEVIPFFNRCGVGMDEHVERLRRSMAAIRIDGFDADEVPSIASRILEINGLDDALLYIQVSRGPEIPRRHIPAEKLRPTVFAYAEPGSSLAELTSPRPLAGALLPDERWTRCDIKATSLLSNVLSGFLADGEGAAEAILFRNGVVSEGTRSTVFCVSEGEVMTPPVNADPAILPGIMRAILIRTAPDIGIRIREEPISVESLRSADEIFITSSRRLLDAVTRLGDRPVGNGTVGPITRALFGRLRAHVAETCGIAVGSPFA